MRRWTTGLLALALFALGAAAGGLVVYLHGRSSSSGDDALPSRRLEATVYLPTTPNPDHPFTPRDWDDALDLLVGEMGGATLGPELEGCWRGDDGKPWREPVRAVVVSFEPGRLGQFRQVLRQVGRKLGQKVLYVRWEQPRVELLAVDP
jgi:hypothetical protein